MFWPGDIDILLEVLMAQNPEKVYLEKIRPYLGGRIAKNCACAIIATILAIGLYLLTHRF